MAELMVGEFLGRTLGELGDMPVSELHYWLAFMNVRSDPDGTRTS